MIKLTVLHYELKLQALKKLHNISQHQEELIFDWEKEVDSAKDMGTEYPTKPFLEPFKFEQSDYKITEKPFRARLKDICFYQESEDNITEITFEGDITFTIKETIEEIDLLFKKSIG
jgi:hypothetical protein